MQYLTIFFILDLHIFFMYSQTHHNGSSLSNNHTSYLATQTQQTSLEAGLVTTEMHTETLSVIDTGVVESMTVSKKKQLVLMRVRKGKSGIYSNRNFRNSRYFSC